MQSTVDQSLSKLKEYIEREHFRGHDPYDALKSPFFKLPILKNNKLIRFGTQQLVKRLPFSIRPLLFVPKGYNPVTLGLCLQAYAYLYRAEPEQRSFYKEKIEFLIEELKKLIPEGFSGACWGYDFDWEARQTKIPAYQPTVVATGIITNALFVAYQITGSKEAARLVVSAADFVLKDLNRTYVEDTLCFSYSPFDKIQVFNASMKGVRLLSQAHSIQPNDEFRIIAKKAVEFVMNEQKKNGSWGYSLAKSGGWTDNYHTGYVLDCLDEYEKRIGDVSYFDQMAKGYSFYLEHFITDKGAPKFYHNNVYPIDCTSASQTILTTVRFGDVGLARKVAQYMTSFMQKRNGSFKFRKFKNYTIKTSFMRWSNAWMFAALAYLNDN